MILQLYAEGQPFVLFQNMNLGLFVALEKKSFREFLQYFNLFCLKLYFKTFLFIPLRLSDRSTIFPIKITFAAAKLKESANVIIDKLYRRRLAPDHCGLQV